MAGHRLSCRASETRGKPGVHVLDLIVSFALLAYAVVATFATVEAGKHPRALYFLFGAEMWERFSYYGMRALLVLYLTKHLNFAFFGDPDTNEIYTGLVY